MFFEKNIDNNLEKDIEKRTLIVSAEIKSNFAFLNDYGYSFVGTKGHLEEENFFLYKRTFVYLNGPLELSITYYPIYCELKKLKVKNYDSFGISIRRASIEGSAQEKKYHTNFLSFEAYLRIHTKAFDESALKIPHYSGSFEEKVEKVLKAYAYFLKECGEDILKGKVWYDDCDPVYNR